MMMMMMMMMIDDDDLVPSQGSNLVPEQLEHGQH